MKMIVTSSLVFASESIAREEISKVVPMPPLPCALGLLKPRAASVKYFATALRKVAHVLILIPRFTFPTPLYFIWPP